MARFSIFTLLFLVTFSSYGKPKNYLLACWNKQVNPTKTRYLSFYFEEKLNQLEHSFEPWQQTNYLGKGTVWINDNSFFKQDTLSTGNRTYFSKTQFENNELLFLDYGDKDLFPVTKTMLEEQVINTLRYSPIAIVDYFLRKNVSMDKSSNKEYALYVITVNKTIVKLFIRKSDNLVTKVVTINDDPLFGDVTTTLSYTNYSMVETVPFPTSVLIEKYNGKVKDEVKISMPVLTQERPELLSKPDNYSVKDDIEEIPEILTEKFNDHIYLFELKHTDDRVLMVEFKDFLLIAEAPINSKNGELIIAEAKKIAPNKLIKYFVFGHYHPHYIGGIRAFVHSGAEIICSKSDEAYVRYLAEAKHELNPDNLQREFKPLKTKEIKDSLSITDGEYEMKLYFIGKKSEHTNDYLIYYFPSEKILFEDDLVWIARSGDIRKAGGRQAGLYHSIKELKLEIKTIIQSWPVKDYGVKTVIPFEDLEKSMTVK